MREVFEWLFEEQLSFRLEDGTSVDGSIFIGDIEFLPVELLREDEDAYRDEFNRWLNQVWAVEQSERREQLLTIHGNRRRFSDLREAMLREQVVPLVGSGMSISSQLPCWSDLLRRIGRYSNVEMTELEELIAESRFEEAADLIASASNRRLLDERVDHELRIDDGAYIEGPIRMLPAMFRNIVVTTNLDEVLERVYLRSGLRFDHVLTGADIARFRGLRSAQTRFLLKLHGDCRDATTRVLLTEEYEAAYAPGSPPREELALVFRNHNILFLGCSLGPDRTVQLCEEVASSDSQIPRHYAFLHLSDRDMLPVDREQFLTERGIYPIWYDGPHDESILALLAGLPGGDGIDLDDGENG